MAIVRGPGASEPFLILSLMKSGKTFDAALAEVEKSQGFKCEQWWIDLNREALEAEAAGEKTAPPPAAPETPTKGKR